LSGDLRGEGCAVGVIEGVRSPDDAESARALAGEAWDDVEVDVHDGLMGVGAVVLEDVECLCAGGLKNGAADARQDAADRGGGLVGECVECRGGFLGDDKDVAGAERVDVEEGEDVVVLVDAMAGDFAADDPGEDGLGHGRSVPGRSFGRIG